MSAETHHPSGWEPEVTGRNTPLHRTSWEVVNDLGHPALGLRRSQLEHSLSAVASLPDGWGDDMASVYALATHGVLSLMLGRMRGMRQGWSQVVPSFVAVLMTERRPYPVPFADFAVHHHNYRATQSWGWGTGVGGFRRLAEESQKRGGFDALELGAPRWEVAGRRDHRALDVAWLTETTTGIVGEAHLPLLPVAACSCFAPSRRRVRPRDGTVVDVPSLWELVAVALALGPEHLEALAQRWTVNESGRQAGARARNREHKGLSRKTLSARAATVNGLFERIAEVARSVPLLATWSLRPAELKVESAVLAQLVARTEDRQAVPLTLYRRVGKQLLASLDDHRQRTRRPDRPRRPQRYTTLLRRALGFNLLGELGCRPGEMVAIVAGDLKVQHHFGEGLVSPAVFHGPKYKGAGDPIDPCWRPISRQTLELALEMVEWLGLGPTDYLFSSGRPDVPFPEAVLAREFTHGLLPKSGGGWYPASSIRHMAEAQAFNVGTLWSNASTGAEERFSAQVLADAYLTHSFRRSDPLGYKDLEARRPLLAARAALGDPARRVPGVHDFLLGDEGSRRGWDTGKLRDCIRGVVAAERDLQRAVEARALAERVLSSLRHAPVEAVDGEEDQVIRYLDALRARTAETTTLEESRDRRLREEMDARARLDSSRLRLEHFESAGRTLALSDDLPMADELEGGDVPFDREPWSLALHRAEAAAGAAREELLGSAPTTSTRVRDHLNLPEFAAVCGVTDRAIRKRLDSPSPDADLFGALRPGGPVVVINSRLRVMAVNRLPPALLDRFLPEQHELMQQLLMVPMGSSRWGGRTVEVERILAIEQLMGVDASADSL